MLFFRSRHPALLIACSMGVLGVVATASAHSGNRPQPAQAQGEQLAQARAVQPASSTQQRAVANHLKARGAVFYGAYWCPACSQQKALFGKEAGAQLPYVECTEASSSARCSAASIRAFPTWDMPSKPRLVGVQSVEELARWSGFRP
jgi:hypothetical protein